IVNHYVPEEDEFPDVLVHKPTGIIVAGKFSEGAYLYVDHECAHIDCPVCRYLKAIEPDKALAYYRIKLIGESYGRIKVSIPVDEIYNGKILTIAYCDDGKLKTVDAVVKDGYVTFIADNFGAFLILNGKYTVHTSGEGYYEMISDIPHPLRADVYRDVDIDDWYYPSIAYSVFLELIEGTSRGSFDPNASATDAQLIRMLEGIEEQIRRVDKDYEKLDVRNLFGHGSKEALAQSKALEMLLAYANLSGHKVNETDAAKWGKEKDLISSDPPGPISRAQLISTVQNYTDVYGPRFLIVPVKWVE
ncbi:MAG: S-layer homology domain-containing protein, partial [Clostridia bacterium]|nr:S-layer homology domain-containing protein [Clostridia bacterium]